MTTTAGDIELRQTCAACPEQYDAYLNGELVGYLRLRHGHFRVRTYPTLKVASSTQRSRSVTGSSCRLSVKRF